MNDMKSTVMLVPTVTATPVCMDGTIPYESTGYICFHSMAATVGNITT